MDDAHEAGGRDARADGVARALRRLVDHELACGARTIADEPVHPGEQSLVAGVAERVRRQTTTGRRLLRAMLGELGITPGPILRTEGGRPALPTGVIGTLAHDDDFAVAVVGSGVDGGIGVDVEPALPLPAEIVDDVVVSPGDRAAVRREVAPRDDHSSADAVDLLRARLLFSVKEAAFKACFALDARYLEFADVTVIDGVLPGELTVATSTGRIVTVRTTLTPRLLAFARVRSDRNDGAFAGHHPRRW